jgi:hypothetical protein
MKSLGFCPGGGARHGTTVCEAARRATLARAAHGALDLAMSTDPSILLGRLARTARHAEYRVRFNAGVRRLATLLPVPLTYGAGALTYLKLAEPSAAISRALAIGLALVLLLPVMGFLSACFARRPRWLGALTLDRHYATADRITNALSFSALAEQSPMMQAAVRDAVRRVERPSARRAVPLALPGDLWVSVALALGVVLLSQLDVRILHPVLPPAVSPPEAILLGADDIDLFRQEIEPLARAADDPELASAVQQFNQLLEDIAERKLDRAEVFRRTAAIEQSLFHGAEADAKALDEALKALARELKNSHLTAPVADALEEQRLADAEQALRKLAERLKQDKSPSPAELEQLRKALEAASKTSDERVSRLEEQRRQIEEQQRRLLKKKGQKDEQATQPPSSEQEQQQRRLERLERELGSARQAQQAMSQLDKDLAKAAEELMKELGDSAQHLEQGAQDMNRMAQKKMSDEQKQALKERLQQLKELLRQGGAGREEHLKRLRNFAQRARGQGSEEQQAGQQGKKPGQGDQQGEGPGGVERIDVPMPGGAGKPDGQGQPGQPQGSGAPSAQREDWGHGTNDKLKGDATQLDGQTEDVSAAAVDTGQGSASSEVVYGAAERGFAGRGYKDVYTQYRTVMEDALSKDEIPAGYEFYVRRYFQLIRPREAQ